MSSILILLRRCEISCLDRLIYVNEGFIHFVDQLKLSQKEFLMKFNLFTYFNRIDVRQNRVFQLSCRHWYSRTYLNQITNVDRNCYDHVRQRHYCELEYADKCLKWNVFSCIISSWSQCDCQFPFDSKISLLTILSDFSRTVLIAISCPIVYFVF